MMKSARLILWNWVLVFMIATPVCASVVYTVGVADNFDGTNGTEYTIYSTALYNAVSSNTNHNQSTQLQVFEPLDTTAGINNGEHNRAVAQTFNFTGLSEITGASLEFRVMAGDDLYTGSDQILFSFVHPGDNWIDSLVWYRPFGKMNYKSYDRSTYSWNFLYSDPGLIQNTEWITWDSGLVTLDLSVLPLYNGDTLNLIPYLNSNGFFDVVVEDETAVDFFTLNVQTVPIPPTILLLGSGLIGMLGFVRRFNK